MTDKYVKHCAHGRGYMLLPGHPDYDYSEDAEYHETNYRHYPTLKEKVKGFFSPLVNALKGDRGDTGAMGPQGNPGKEGQRGAVMFLKATDAEELMQSVYARDALKNALRTIIKEDPSLLSDLK